MKRYLLQFSRLKALNKSLSMLYFIVITIFSTSNLYSQYENPAKKYANAYKKYENATCPVKDNGIQNFVYFSRDRELIKDHPFLKMPQFKGAQIMYSWRQLEPEKGKYDFSEVKEDYEYLRSKGKKLFIQLQDATFDPNYNATPKYLLTDEYDGGAAEFFEEGKAVGWVAKRWNPKVQERYAAFLEALGKEFDDKIEGINLQETAIGTVKNLTPEVYVKSIKANMLSMKKAFPKSTTMQYANFISGEWLPWEDKGYLRSIYKYGQEIGVGLGGPDLMVQKKAQLNHALKLMHEGKFTVPLGIAVQDGNYIGETGNTEIVQKNKNIVPMLSAFAKDFLKVKYMFWVNQEPYFIRDVVPCFSSIK